MPNEATATAGDLPDTAPTNAQTTAVNAHPVAVGINPTGQLATQLATQLAELVAAAFPAIWVETAEPQEALREIHQLCHAQDWRLAGWDCEAGLTIHGEPASLPTLSDSQDPLAVIRALPEISRSASTTVLTLENLHRFLGSIELVQAIIRQAQTGKQTRVVLLVLAPLTQLPPELEKLFICLDHQLPDTPQLAEIARGVAAEADELPDNEAFDRVLDAARGLTRSEAENAFSLSLVRHGRLDPETLWQLKAQQVRKSGLLTIHQGGDSFSQLGGLANLKQFARRALRRHSSGQPDCRARGILLLGPPGAGKSAFAKALGNEVGRPTIVLDIGGLLGSLVGQSEANLRTALKLCDAMSPCIVFVDELEKALAGTVGSGTTDSGVGARVFSGLLTWLSDHTSDCFFIATANDISRLPPEFTRAERFDATFYVSLPGREDREQIWQIHLGHFGLDPTQRRPDDHNWSGAEIRSCCRLARLLNVSLEEAAANIVPVAVTAADTISGLERWASGRCLSAEGPGIFQPPSASGSRCTGSSQATPLRRATRSTLPPPGLN